MELKSLADGELDLTNARFMANLITSDDEFPLPVKNGTIHGMDDLTEKLTFIPDNQRSHWSDWLRKGAPLGRRMHRNTRNTLKRYYALGLLDNPPPKRRVSDRVFDYGNPQERTCYDQIKAYIDERYQQLEKEKAGKGFVMTTYRRRASSSPLALRRSLNRRKEKVEKIAHRQSFDPLLNLEEEQIDSSDLVDEDIDERIDPGLPTSPKAAEAERQKIEELLAMLDLVGSIDSKQVLFWNILEEATADGRPVLVFTEYTDTMEYLRDQLRPTYGPTLGCFSGRGGEIWEGNSWKVVSKAEITDQLRKGN